MNDCCVDLSHEGSRGSHAPPAISWTGRHRERPAEKHENSPKGPRRSAPAAPPASTKPQTRLLITDKNGSVPQACEQVDRATTTSRIGQKGPAATPGTGAIRADGEAPTRTEEVAPRHARLSEFIARYTENGCIS